MTRCLVLGIVTVLFVPAAGRCDELADLAKAQVGLLNQLAESFEKKEPTEKQKAILEKIRTTGEKIDLLRLTEGERKATAKATVPALQKAIERITEAMPANTNGVTIPPLGGLFGLEVTELGGAEFLIRSMIRQMDELSQAMEKKESKEKIKAIATQLKATGEKMKTLKLSKDEDERLKKKYESELTKVMGRLMGAAMKAGPDTDLGEILK